MKMICKIAKTELRTLFYSPVAWFLSVAFLVQCAVFYTSPLLGLARGQDMALIKHPWLKEYKTDLTPIMFLYPDGIFEIALHNLYLFIPLLTMGLISRDINDGTIKLLYSSPVKTRQIVLGKYLGIIIFNLLLVLIIGVFIVTGLCNIRYADYGLLLSAVLGFYLLLCAYAAIGMFMSSLSTYQIVSAIGSFTTLFVLDRIGGLWQKYDLVRDLTYFLCISGRTEKMLWGLIRTNDVVYFVLIIVLFLAFTLFRLKGGKEIKPWFLKAGRYLSVLLSVLVIGYLSSLPRFMGYWDTTANKRNTLHRNVQAIIKELGDDSLDVTLYTNLLNGLREAGLPESRNWYLWGFWERYLRFKPDIQFRYVYYYDKDDNDSSLYRLFPGKNLKQIAKEQADDQEYDLSMFKAPEYIRTQIDLQPENYQLVMQLKYKGRTTFLRTFDDTRVWPDEQQVAAALKRLLQAKMSKVLFVTGDLERNIYKTGEREYRSHSTAKNLRSSLINLGFDVDTASLDHNDIPDDIATLVLADPKTRLSETSLHKIEQYLDKGGNMVILGEPGKQDMLNPLLRHLGVQLMDGTLVQLSKDEMPHIILPYVTKAASGLAEETKLLRIQQKRDSGFVLMPGAAPVAYIDSSLYHMDPLLLTLPQKTWLKVGRLVTDSAPPVFDPGEGDLKKESFSTSVALTRPVNNRQQRIVVCGDADFMSNSRNESDYFTRGFYSWLNEGKFPVYSPRPDSKDTMLRITGEGASALKIIYVWILPGLVLLGGTILLIRRKRQ